MDITKDQFDAYERVRQSGVTNMFAVNTVSALSGLTPDTVVAVMKQYGELADKYKQDA